MVADKIASPPIHPPKVSRFSHDFETYSQLDLKKVGASRYSRHPSTEVLMLGYRFDSRPVKQWVPVEGQLMPAEVEDAILDDRIIKSAWNKPFEWAIWTNCLGIRTPHSVWRDPMVLALSCSLPGKLEKTGPIMGLPEEFLKKDGTRLINWFSKDRPATKTQPARRIHWYQKYDLWLEYLDYNRSDVLAESKIALNLSPYDLPDHEWELWALDQEINERGIPINMGMVQNAILLRDEFAAEMTERMQHLTGLENPNSGAQLLPWLQERGYQFSDLKAGHVRRAVEKLKEPGSNLPKELREVLGLRLQLSKTSTKKFDALASMVDSDGNLRNAHQFAGAGRTWRWAGRGFQVQNLARPERGLDGLDWEKLASGAKQVVGGTQIEAAIAVATMDANTMALLYNTPMDVLSGAVRTVVQAPDGYVFIDADLAAIENVGLGWVAGDKKILSVFSEGKDPYIDFATFLYKRPYDDLYNEWKVQGDKTKRTVAKPGVLGCLKGETPVLTHKGWKALVELKDSDWLHDGEKWVRHSGVVFKGYREVLCVSGVYATKDHKFLTQDGWAEWQQVCQPETFVSALAMGSGVFLQKQALPAAQGKSIFAPVNVVENVSYRDQTSSEDYPLVAPGALQLTVAPRSESESARVFTTYSQIVSMLRDRVAKTQKIISINTTARGEFAASSVPQTSGSRTSSSTSGRTVRLKLIVSTTAGTMKSGTSNSPHGRSRTQIADTWDILNSGDYARFAVLTENGCVVAHNCGYMLSAGHQYEDKQTGEIEATGLLGYAWNMGVKLTPEQSDLSVKVWRQTYTEAVQFWWDIDRAAKKCISTGKETSVRSIRFDRKGPFLRMLLPSNRALHYLRPRMEEWLAPWGEYKMSVTYEQLNDKHQWDRVSTHPGKLTENCWNSDTLILTNNGVKRIVEVQESDLVWDGRGWTAHSGVIPSGDRETINLGGARVTPEHRIEVDGGWVEACSISADSATSSFERHYGRTLRDALRDRASRLRRPRSSLVDFVRLRVGGGDVRFRVSEEASKILRLQSRESDLSFADHTRDDQSPRVSRLEVNDCAMHEPKAQGAEELRRQRDHGGHGVAGVVPSVLERHGADLSFRVDSGEAGQHGGIPTRQLRLEGSQGAGQEHEVQPRRGHTERSHDHIGGSRGQRDREDDHMVSGEHGVPDGEVVRPTRRVEQVYDLTNCGPRQAFTVVLPDGRLILSHNCVQALARDLLAHGMTLAAQRGIKIVMHVHDQILALVKEDEAEEKLKVLMDCMGARPPWAKDIPVRAAGHISKWFVKD